MRMDTDDSVGAQRPPTVPFQLLAFQLLNFKHFEGLGQSLGKPELLRGAWVATTINWYEGILIL